MKKELGDILSSSDSTHGLKRAARRLLKELAIYANHKKNIIRSRIYLKKDFEKVQIGGGSHLLDGFLNIDVFPPADLIYDIREGIPLKSNSVKLIFSEHFLEHIDYPISVKFFVNECYRVLKKRGELIIGVPDSSLPIKAYLKNDKKFFNEIIKRWYSKRDCLGHFNTYIDLVNYHFRDQDDNEKYTPHLWSYDKNKLTSLLVNGGFTAVKKWKFDSKLANKERQFGSIYIIAKK